MHKATVSILAWLLLFTTPPLTKAQDESPVVVRVERIIKNEEPSWRYIRGIQSGRVPRVPSEKILVTSVWERKWKNGKRESVSANIYEVASVSEAGIWLKPVSEGGAATVWKVERYRIGDEGYLSEYQKGRRYSLYFRKDNIVAEMSGESLGSVKRFAKYVASGLGAI